MHYFDCAMLGVSLECKVEKRRRNTEKLYIILLLRPVVKKCCARLLKNIDVGKLESNEEKVLRRHILENCRRASIWQRCCEKVVS